MYQSHKNHGFGIRLRLRRTPGGRYIDADVPVYSYLTSLFHKGDFLRTTLFKNLSAFVDPLS
jgi:hypothetical protein